MKASQLGADMLAGDPLALTPTPLERETDALVERIRTTPPTLPDGTPMRRVDRRRAQKRRMRILRRRLGYVARHADGPPKVDYALTDRQADVFESRARFRVLIAGRRFGKTYLACVELITAASSRPKSVCWYVAPTYRMAKDIAWELLKALVPAALLAGTPNESTLAIRLRNGSVIQLKGAEKYDRLRGRTLWFVVLDEFAQMHVKVWDAAIRPSLSTTKGGAVFISTPMGFNWGHDFYLRGQDTARPRWVSWQFTTAQGGLVDEEELEEAKSVLDPRLFRQEFHASFEALSGRIYLNFDTAIHVKADADDDGVSDILVGIDFNVNPMSAVFAIRGGEARDECHVFDAWEIPSSNTTELAQEINRRWPRTLPHPNPVLRAKGKTIPGRTIITCPDPSGRARSTKAVTGETDFSILERAGFAVLASEAHDPWKDGVNNVNALLRDAAGRSRVKINPRAKALIKALSGFTYKEGTSLPDRKSADMSGLEHITDAFRYLAWQQFNLWLRYSRSQHFAV